MSRTIKEKPPVGKEYWSARPFNKCGQSPGAYAKRRTHKAERRQGKRHEAG